MKYLFVFGLLLVLTTPSQAQVGLEDAYLAALNRNEVIAQQKELVYQAEEHVKQARGSILPNISGLASYLRQDAPGATSSGNIAPKNQPLVKVTGTQPIFRGLREYSAFKEAKVLVQAEEQTKFRATVLLYEDVADAFYSRLSFERDLKNLQEEIELFQARVQDLKSRVKIGRSSESEVLTLNTSLESRKAELEGLKGRIKVAQERFEHLTALPGNTPLQESQMIPTETEALEAYLKQVDLRPDIQADQHRFEAAKRNLWVAKGAHLPSADLTGNYIFYRTGFLADSHWDVTATMTVPLFEGGITQSRVREASSQLRQSELELARTRRAAQDEVKSRYLLVQSDLSQLKALEQSKIVSEKTYQFQKRDYSHGLVTNIDVLLALTTSSQAKRSYDQAQYTTKLDFDRLESAVVRRPKELETK